MNIDAKAEKLIKRFAAALLVLSGGKKIPEPWAIKLRKALRPARRQRGNAFDLEKNAAVVKALVDAGGMVRGPRTKRHNPGIAKNRIATDVPVSRKTVDRRARELQALDGRADLPADSRKRSALLTGISNAIMPEILSELDREQSARLSRRTLKR